MRHPKIILESGTIVKTNPDVQILRLPKGLFLMYEMPSRRSDSIGTILGEIPKTQGSIYWIRHEDGLSAPYMISEFEVID